MIKDINNEFNNILNKTFWEEKEYNLYNTLRLVINKYEKHAKYYLLNKKDKPNIINNYIENNNECFFKRPVMNNVLNSLYIIEYISELNNKINFLLVKIRFNDFCFLLYSKNENFKLIQKLKIINIKNKNENYVINHNDKKIDYNILSNIMHYKGAKLTNDEMYSLIFEIIIYYNLKFSI